MASVRGRYPTGSCVTARGAELFLPAPVIEAIFDKKEVTLPRETKLHPFLFGTVCFSPHFSLRKGRKVCYRCLHQTKELQLSFLVFDPLHTVSPLLHPPLLLFSVHVLQFVRRRRKVSDGSGGSVQVLIFPHKVIAWRVSYLITII
jgi:hypothetical protein